MCGSDLTPPESSTHRSPGPTSQIGQETELNCFGVTSLILIELGCDSADAKTVRFCTHSIEATTLRKRSASTFRDSLRFYFAELLNSSRVFFCAFSIYSGHEPFCFLLASRKISRSLFARDCCLFPPFFVFFKKLQNDCLD